MIFLLSVTTFGLGCINWFQRAEGAILEWPFWFERNFKYIATFSLWATSFRTFWRPIFCRLVKTSFYMSRGWFWGKITSVVISVEKWVFGIWAKIFPKFDPINSAGLSKLLSTCHRNFSRKCRFRKKHILLKSFSYFYGNYPGLKQNFSGWVIRTAFNMSGGTFQEN